MNNEICVYRPEAETKEYFDYMSKIFAFMERKYGVRVFAFSKYSVVQYSVDGIKYHGYVMPFDLLEKIYISTKEE